MKKVARRNVEKTNPPSILYVSTLCLGLATAFIGARIEAAKAQAPGLTTLHQFTGGADGATLLKGVSIDSAGNLYGNSFYGANACPDSYQYAGVGCGVVWKLDTQNNFSTLVTFLGAKNGADPDGNLTIIGNQIYGSAYTGGKSNLGAIFQVATDGTGFKTLHTFNDPSLGTHPDSFLRFDSAGDMFSEAPFGGQGYTGADFTGNGVLFRLTPAGTYSVEHYFTGGADGADPQRIFLQQSTQTFFGTAYYGGSCSGAGLPAAGCGVVFSYEPANKRFKVLYTFTGGADGYLPFLAGVLENGDIYGETYVGGAYNYGTIFKLTPKASGDYKYVHLYDFTGGADGGNPEYAALTPAGTLIGPTIFGGSQGAGVLYEFHNGEFKTLFTFSNNANGGYPYGTPVIAPSGVIYGTTAYGGIAPCNTTGGTLISSYGCGTVFEFKR